MFEGLGKVMLVALVFYAGMSTSLWMEKLGKMPRTCQITNEIFSEYGGAR